MNDLAAPATAPPPFGRVGALLVAHAQLARYVVIGGTAFLIDIGLFALLAVVAGLPALLANTVSVCISVVFSYLVNAFANFRVRDRMLVRFMSFAVVSGIGFLISTAMLWPLVELLHLDPLLSKVITVPVVVAVQFLLNKRITFGAALAAPSERKPA